MSTTRWTEAAPGDLQRLRDQALRVRANQPAVPGVAAQRRVRHVKHGTETCLGIHILSCRSRARRCTPTPHYRADSDRHGSPPSVASCCLFERPQNNQLRICHKRHRLGLFTAQIGGYACASKFEMFTLRDVEMYAVAACGLTVARWSAVRAS